MTPEHTKYYNPILNHIHRISVFSILSLYLLGDNVQAESS